MVYGAFYKAEYGDWIDTAIVWRTWSRYSHVEIAFPDLEGGYDFFSSSPRDGGCRWKKIEADEKWDLVPISDDIVDPYKVCDFCRIQDGMRYDWRGVLAFMIPLIPASGDAWFCSEVCAAALRYGGLKLPRHPNHISPEGLYEILIKQVRQDSNPQR